MITFSKIALLLFEGLIWQSVASPTPPEDCVIGSEVRLTQSEGCLMESEDHLTESEARLTESEARLTALFFHLMPYFIGLILKTAGINKKILFVSL